MDIKDDTNNIELVPKKKRGRKPKPKPINEPVKEKKKRGRKPKIKIVNDEDINKFILPSKRGRKPKDKLNIFDKNLNLDSISNCILHLPIPLSKIEEIDNHNTKQDIIPYDPSVINNQIELDDSTNICIYSNIEDSDNNKNHQIENSDINVEESIISDKSNYTKNFNNCPNSNIKCNWCLYECNNDNIYKLPYIIKNNDIEYYGNFCCPECAGAFNFNELNDQYTWERYSLLNYLYNQNSNTKLFISPSRLLLDIFGGPLNINEYRSIINEKKQTNIIIPPHYIICPQVDINQSISSNNIGFVPLNLDRVNKYTNHLKTQSDNNNKLVNNSLKTCMKLKCI